MNLKRISVWSSGLVLGAALFALLFAGLRAQPVSADPDPSITYISTWGSGSVSQTVPLTYTGADILQYGGVTRTGAGWTKYFDAAAAGLNPVGQWKHNLNAIWISDTVAGRNGVNSGEFFAAFTQNQQKGIPGIDGWVDGYDIVYWNGYSFTLWFDGNDVGLTNKTQEKIDALDILWTAPVSSTFSGEDCEAYILLSTQGAGMVDAPPTNRLRPDRKPVLKFRGEDVLGFCATNLGTNTTGFWEMVIDGSTYAWPDELPGRRIPTRFTDSIASVPEILPFDGYYVLANRKLPYHSVVFGFDPESGDVQGPIESFALMGITSPVDALHVSADIIR